MAHTSGDMAFSYFSWPQELSQIRRIKGNKYQENKHSNKSVEKAVRIKCDGCSGLGAMVSGVV